MTASTLPHEQTAREQSPSARDAWTRVALGAGLLGLVLRFVIAWTTLGSNDITTWASFGRAINATSLGNVYDTIPGFNHPPLMGFMAALAEALSRWSHVGFQRLFKMPIIAAECIGAWLVYRSWNGWSRGDGSSGPASTRGTHEAALAFLIFCWNPASISISAYHGNTDALCALLPVLAAILLDRGRSFWAGVALAGAINVKLIPILVIPVLLSRVHSRRDGALFLGGLSLGAIPFLPFLLTHWKGFNAHVLHYVAVPGFWGFPELFMAVGNSPHLAQEGATLLSICLRWGKILVLAMPIALGVGALWARRRWSPQAMVAMVFCWFLVITPGFGVQYAIYPVLPLFVVHLRYAFSYSFLAGAYVSMTYVALRVDGSPAFSDFNQNYPLISQYLAAVAWVCVVTVAVKLTWPRLRLPGWSRWNG